MSEPLSVQLKDPATRAFYLLRTVFTIAPIVFGLDKFFNLLPRTEGLTGSLAVEYGKWEMYLADWINDITPGNASDAMHIIGVIEIVAGVLVLLAPRIGAYVVAIWLAGIILDLLTLSGYYDVALRDFGLLVAALSLGQLAEAQHKKGAIR